MKNATQAAVAVLEERGRVVLADEKIRTELVAAEAAIPLAEQALTRALVELRTGERHEVPDLLRTAASDARQAVVDLTAEAGEIGRRLGDLDAKLGAADDALMLVARAALEGAAKALADAKAKAIAPLAAALRRYWLVLGLAAVGESPELGAVNYALLALGATPEALTPSRADDAPMHEATQIRTALRIARLDGDERRRAEALRARRAAEGAK